MQSIPATTGYHTLRDNICSSKREYGGVAEWSKAAVLKTVVPLPGTGGSNPSPSARGKYSISNN